MKKAPEVLIGLSIICVILSVIGAFAGDLWLASTQWILIAGVLAIWAVYLRMTKN